MKYLRATATVDTEAAPPLMTLLVDSPRISEARKVNWSATRDGGETVLYAIDGDAAYFRDRAGEAPSVESVELSPNEQGQTYALVEMQPLETPLVNLSDRACSRPGLVIHRPIVYRDGQIIGHVIGEPEHLQAAIDQVDEMIRVRIDEIGTVRGDPTGSTSRLSQGQREALATAFELGYYDQPRRATHADVAEELGCAPPTASEHLQKAEAKLVHAAMDELGQQV